MSKLTPKIGIYGRVNAGKSSLLNFLTGQDIAIVSHHAGTTTDPVRRSYELLGYGAVTFIDTAGFDDTSSLGEARLKKTLATIDEIDFAIFVLSSGSLADDDERAFIKSIDRPTILVEKPFTDQLCDQIISTLNSGEVADKPFFGDLLHRGDHSIFVCPIDSEAPVGRLILPQVQAIRAALDLGASVTVVQPSMLAEQLKGDKKISLIVTDSQAFREVSQVIGSRDITLTSFSILLADQKGDSKIYKQGLSAVSQLRNGDRVLVVEHCSHGVSCDDIGRVKIPKMLQSYIGGAELKFDFVTGREPLPDDLSVYAIAIQCGGCMVGRRSIMSPITKSAAAGLPITNYGMLLRLLSK